ncbi:MAG: hypothetical protein KGM47_03865, partial [Acidobacteriota bacterium]|nr:hypothetical protein [Acidobacteriota bacterium]
MLRNRVIPSAARNLAPKIEGLRDFLRSAQDRLSPPPAALKSSTPTLTWLASLAILSRRGGRGEENKR